MNNKGILSLIGLVVLICFQNCGFSGFITQLESTSSSPVSDLSGRNGTTDLTTIPKGQLTRFEIPDQLVTMRLSIIDLSQNQILAYSHRFAKLISFNPDGNGFQDIVLPEAGLEKIISAKAFSKFSIAGSSRHLFRNPGTAITFRSSDGVIRHGIFGTKNRTWVKLDFQSDCSVGVRSAGTAGNFLAFCDDNANSNNYFQIVNENGQKVSSVIKASQAFQFINARALSSTTMIDSEFKKSINLTTGTVSNMDASFSSAMSSPYIVYRSESNSLVFVSTDYESIIEKNITTGQERVLMSSTYSYTIHPINENFFIAYDQNTRAKYLVSSTGTNAINTLAANVAGFAISESHLALFIPDPSSTSIKMSVQLMNVNTLATSGLCSTASSASSDFYGNLIGYAGFDSYFTNSIANDPNLRGSNMAFVMDKTCSDIYLPTIFRSQDGTMYVRKLFKYNSRTNQNQVIYTHSIANDGMGYFGDYLALEKGALYFYLPNSREIHVAGNGTSSVLGTMIWQNLGEPMLSEWNTAVGTITYPNGSSDFLFSGPDTGLISFKLPKAKSTPIAKFLTNGGRNYVLMTKDTLGDSADTESYIFQFYDENNTFIKREKLDVNIKNSSLTELAQIDRSNTDSPYVAIKLMSSVGDKVKHAFMVINLVNQTVSAVEPSLEIGFSYDAMVTADGNIIGFNAFCQVSRKQCVNNPFGENLANASGSFTAFIDGDYFYSFYSNGVSSFKRFKYDGNLGFSLVKSFGDQYPMVSSDNRWVYFSNYTTKKISVYNVVSGVTQEIENTYDSASSVKGGLLANVKEADQTYTYSFIDFATLKPQKLTELSGGTENFYLVVNDGKLLNSKTSDTIALISQVNLMLFNIKTKKIVKKIPMPFDSKPVWENGKEVLFAQTYAASYINGKSDYKYKMVLLDMDTLVETNIDISMYTSIICKMGVSADLYCLGRKAGIDYILKYISSTRTFETVVELNKDLSFGGLLKLSKDLTFISLSSINFVERYIVFPYSNSKSASIGDGWDGYIYK